MPRVALAFAYDGTRFDSFARQPGRRTVEGELLRCLLAARAFGHPRSAGFSVASRTDKDVSAQWNVCAFDSVRAPGELAHLPALPEGLLLLGGARAPEGFDPRAEATSRTYAYWVDRDDGIDLRRLRAAARLFEGTHDFRNFCRLEPGKDPRRRLEKVRIDAGPQAIVLRFSARSFLWEQVRRIVQAILDVARARQDLGSVRSALRHPAPARPQRPAEARRLVLERVEVPLEWPHASRSTRLRLDGLAGEARIRARFYEGLAASSPITRR